jgi:hypothetical protein
MASRRVTDEPAKKSRRSPATTPEARENQLIAAAVDLAEKQIAEGTASSQVISHYLKLGSSRERLEQERLARENELLQAKAEAMASAKRVEELYETALNAMRSYAGQAPLELEETFDD